MSYRDRLQQRLEETGRPLRVGLIGAGQMGRGFAAQLLRMPGITLSAVLDVQRDRAEDALGQAGITPDPATTTDAAAQAIENGGSVALGGIDELGALPLDIVVEATGVPDVGARAAVESLAAGMGFATLNVESDVTIGRYLAQIARESGAIYSVCRGDEPVETKILVDYARDLNFEVICAGKGKNNPLDRYATPESLAERATSKGMNAKMLTSFVDGSKAMIEMASLANTTGLGVSKRGMHGPPSTVPTLHQTFALVEDGGVLEKAGVVDYCTGPVAPGVFVVVRTEDPYVHHEMTYLQMGDGPYFALYRPYHLASLEAPLTVYEMALDHRASLTSEHWTAEVGAETKRPLKAGERIDGIGGSTVRGLIDAADDFVRDNGVPLGVLAGATARPRRPGRPPVDLRRRRAARGLRDRPDAPHPGGDGQRGGAQPHCAARGPGSLTASLIGLMRRTRKGAWADSLPGCPSRRVPRWWSSPVARVVGSGTTPTRCCCPWRDAGSSPGRSAGHASWRTSRTPSWSSASRTARSCCALSTARSRVHRCRSWSAATAATAPSGRPSRLSPTPSSAARSTWW